MTTAMTVPRPGGIQYHVEELTGDRGQLMADVVIGGRRGRRYRFGTPASLDSVRTAAMQLNRFPSPSAKPEARDRRPAPTPSAR